jgi:DnaJ-class molecular chaperone
MKHIKTEIAEVECPFCDGQGYRPFPGIACGWCDGTGKIEEEKTITEDDDD